jgi:flagellar basal-body rod protein FlgF
MAGSIYVALSGMRTRMAQLEHVAADIANEGTAGYKGERSASLAVNRPTFDAALNAAVDTVPAPSRIDFRPGVILSTRRDMDLAIEGRGFFVVNTPAGLRYTRNGNLSRSADGTLVTADNMPVVGQDGPIKLPAGEMSVEPDGSVIVNRAAVGQLRLVDFADYGVLGREDGGRFRAPAGVDPTPAASAQVRGGALEQSNVAVSQRMAHLMEVTRAFEALQRGVSVMANDIDARAISEIGRR